MISSVRGTVLSAVGSSVIIDVGGIGYAVQVTPEHSLSLRVGEQALIHTSLIVREDSLSLFGFETTEQLHVFDLLTGVTGVGPKSALGVLSVLGPGQIAAAVAAEDDKVFRKVSGIGPKTAKLIVLSLTGKLIVTTPVEEPVAVPAAGDSVVVALVGLGWSEKVAVQAVSDVLSTHPDAETAPVQTVLRLALAQLGPAQHSTSSASAGARQ
ncbi:Holliday junction branch migration protein RuvA [Mycetocola zhadangensis]|uniref:Holliday junction branch migration complex subunit RuvA n=1 Tax=Mycetocola zhadangensis TaxID=1164595 RepID=A0A3L7J645_9MICO|nr:Holliday junction branch migration protein RuvA [Mycetocola zhadangensis]RLQ86096.1 Holliday junction branch migration protein RuvA [Mycetocola zhadangensis]GGE88350.1 Holliday junction ATP-dependent DNA helicase RuvA [Mycetocola zhadangensis]